jgi:hypothetical protein
MSADHALKMIAIVAGAAAIAVEIMDRRCTQGGELPDSRWVYRLVGVDYSEAEAAGPE